MVNETRIEGIGALSAGQYETILITGIAKGNGDLAFDAMYVEGKFHGKGRLDGRLLNVDGIVSESRRVKVKELCVNGFLQVKSERVYGDHIEVNGILKCPLEISGDEIRVDGYVETDLLCGDEIELLYRETRRLERFMSFMGRKRPLQSVKRVECTHLEATAFSCAHVCAQRVTLHDHCRIDVIECDGVIELDKTCEVKEFRGAYTLKQI